MTIISITSAVPPADVFVSAAPYAPAGAIIAATSRTMTDVRVPGPGGDYVFKVEETGLGFLPGLRVRASPVDDPQNWVEGIVKSFDGETIIITADSYNGFGNFDHWNINVSGERGPRGERGDPGPMGPNGTPWGLPMEDAF